MKDFLIYIGQHFFPSKISVIVDDGTWKIPLEDRIITLSYDGKVVAKTRKRRNVDAVPRPSGMRKTIKQDVDPEEVLRLLGKRINTVERPAKPMAKPAAKSAKQRKATAVPKSASKAKSKSQSAKPAAETPKPKAIKPAAKPAPEQRKVAAEQKPVRKPKKKFAEGSVVSTKYAPNTYTVVSQKDNIVVVFEKSTNITREVALSDLV